MRPARGEPAGPPRALAAAAGAPAAARAPLLLPRSEGALRSCPAAHGRGARVVVRAGEPSRPSGRAPAGAAARARRAGHRGDHLRGEPRRRASTGCSRPGARPARPGEELLVAGARRRTCARPAMTPPAEEGVRVVGLLAARRVPRAAAPRARIRLCAPPRGLRDRPAGGARRRLPSGHHAGARAIRGSADRTRARRASGRRRSLRLAANRP